MCECGPVHWTSLNQRSYLHFWRNPSVLFYKASHVFSMHLCSSCLSRSGHPFPCNVPHILLGDPQVYLSTLGLQLLLWAWVCPGVSSKSATPGTAPKGAGTTSTGSCHFLGSTPRSSHCHPAERTHFGCLYAHSHTASLYHEAVSTREGWDKDTAVKPGGLPKEAALNSTPQSDPAPAVFIIVNLMNLMFKICISI